MFLHDRAEFQHGPIIANPSELASYTSLYESALAAQAATTDSQDLSATTTTDDSADTSITTSIPLEEPTTLATSVTDDGSSDTTSLVAGSAATATVALSTSPLLYSTAASGEYSTDGASSPTSLSSSSSIAGLGAATTSLAIQSSLSSDTGSTQSSLISSIPTPNSATDGGYGFADHRHHMAGGHIAAAVILPLLALALLALAGMCLFTSRRRRRQGQDFHPVAEMRQKIQQPFRPSATAQPHIGTSPHNATYFTGLDTASQHDGETPGRGSFDAPPPYAGRAAAASTFIQRPEAAHYDPHYGNAGSIPRLQVTNWGPTDISPFEPSADDVGAAGVAAVAAGGAAARDLAPSPALSNKGTRPGTSRQPSSQSITSTLYSSNASVNEAEPAHRVSMSESRHVRSISGHTQDGPFADPESPVSFSSAPSRRSE